MVLNDKILNRKFRAIMQILDQDGGVTLIEALGVLEWAKINMIEGAKAGKLKNRQAQQPQQDYGALKARRISEMS